MSYNDLNLPSDIPWKRLGASADMIATKENFEFPEKWKSSIAVFYHEPSKEELGPDYCNRKITFLKISCTITNFTDCRNGKEEEFKILEEMNNKRLQFYAPSELHDIATNSYPCYGALLQVAVLGKSNKVIPLHDQPYISHFEPKKREIYQTRTESGEMLSGSNNSLGISKSNSTSNNTENRDSVTGGNTWNFSGVFGLAQGSESQAQRGIIYNDSSQDQNVINTDSSREKRESLSHSTQLNQLYTELQSFHIGTNRSIFFMQPKPNFVDSRNTFIRGIRRLEGIQDFFLIVNRPNYIKGINLEVALETGHIPIVKKLVPRFISSTETFSNENFKKLPQVFGIDDQELQELYPNESELLNNWNSAPPMYRSFMLEYINGGSGVNDIARQNQFGGYQSNWPLLFDLASKGDLSNHGKVSIIFEQSQHNEGGMFITGRKFKASIEVNDDQQIETSHEINIDTESNNCSVVFENSHLADSINRVNNVAVTMKDFPDYYNSIINQIKNEMEESINSPNRVPYGKMKLTDSLYFTTKLLQTKGLFDKGVSLFDLEETIISETKNRVEQKRNKDKKTPEKLLEIVARREYNKELLKEISKADVGKVKMNKNMDLSNLISKILKKHPFSKKIEMNYGSASQFKNKK